MPKHERSKKTQRIKRYDHFTDDFDSAEKLAFEYRFILQKCSHVHYQLTCADSGTLLNIYPGNRKLWFDSHYYQPPEMKTPVVFTLENIIKELAKVLDKQRQR